MTQLINHYQEVVGIEKTMTEERLLITDDILSLYKQQNEAPCLNEQDTILSLEIDDITNYFYFDENNQLISVKNE